MATNGLSLVGFLQDEQAALAYLTRVCVPPNPDPKELRKQWTAARAKLGGPCEKAGEPDFLPTPPECEGYWGGVKSRKEYAPWIKSLGWQFRCVEIAPLLAFQFHVDLERSASLCDKSKDLKQTRGSLEICLPQTPQPIRYEPIQAQSGLMIKSRSLNLRALPGGAVSPDAKGRGDVVGALFAVAPPLVQVVRFDGRCFLSNGYHRAYGLQQAGATHMFCIFREVNNYWDVGAREDGSTFSQAIMLDKKDPPTLGHLFDDRAWAVRLRAVSRLITVTWAEYVIADE